MPIDRHTVPPNLEEMSTSDLIESLVETACVDSVAHTMSFALVQADGQAWRDELRKEINRRIPWGPR